MESLNCNPIDGMVQIAQKPGSKSGVAREMFSELAHYVYPKRKVIEHTGEDGDVLRIEVTGVRGIED